MSDETMSSKIDRLKGPSGRELGPTSEYAVYVKNGDVKAVKRGWIWPAFFLSILWAMYKGLWVLAAQILVVAIGIELVSFAVSLPVVTGALGAAGFGYVAYVAANASDWVEAKLERKGYEFKQLVAAGSPHDAVTYFDALH